MSDEQFTNRTELHQRRHDDRGATAVEYALMITFIATAIVATVALVGGDLINAFQSAVDGF